eukprot:TRINITY_DN103273_c0_g1_i1.p1 TRINITY_DN103273_c0_g1~~TRINITY_DN103273_c0_g1_i1.p1  ORF type:complete len:372 (+),score=221.80 TRINITY_DN103273_c0_g1_i1:120-1235(+)
MSNQKFLMQMRPWFDHKEADAVYKYMKTDAFFTEFKYTRAFEQQVAKYCGAKHCFMVNNGTVSLSIALMALGVGPGDEVLIPNVTMIATPNSATMIGAKVKFVDIDEKTLCMDIDKMLAAISPRTKAVVHVSLHGRTNDIERFVAAAHARGVPVLEDSAQSLGSRYKGRQIGTFGDIGSFSFSAPKIISTGQGGCLITDDDDLAHKIGRIKDFGRARGGLDWHEMIGGNYKFTDIQAIIGIEQMKKLPWRVNRMRQLNRLYRQLLAQVPQVRQIETEPFDGFVPWFFDIYVDEPDKLAAFLKKKGIGSRRIYPACHTQPCYKEHNGLSYPVAERVGKTGLWLPSSSALSDADVRRVCAAVKEFYSSSASKL